MQSKSPLPWDLEHAITAFQVNPNWYEEYWLKPTRTDSFYMHRRPDGSIDGDFYRGRAKHERDIAMRKYALALFATIRAVLRRAESRLRNQAAHSPSMAAAIAPDCATGAKP